ncbi:ATP-binding cassette domain-containing protein [Streptomyces triticagri]|uniref:ATP-binding cassette domain-containing protein n=1 Tax=Streptomyces triticagri TaxID=2293568 RepID=A0A372M810_9ACTN|nr:ATP-binding cassette domain-containing protein [Streptomyces triticagri]RFU87076.1 ATP-binding cassette domain-containing protein [Streptomyces triticagri]
MTRELELRDVRLRYGPLEALHGIGLAVPAGATTVLVGRNGSGRSSVLRAVAGTVRLSGGSVRWRGQDVTRWPAHERARRGLVFVPERQAVFASLSVAENLALPVRHRDTAPALDAYPELAPLLHRTAATLSGGEQRMLALGRALLARPRLLVVDEPTQGMSPAVAERTYRLLAGLDATVLLAEQRLPPGPQGGATAQRPVIVHELRRGTVVFSGEAAGTRRRP